MNDSGYLKYLTAQPERKSLEALSLLNQFLKRVQAFEASAEDKTVKAFLAELNLDLESGEEGALASDLDVGPEAIRILTVHGAKGLEFKHVFIVNLVDKRFPTIARSEQINLPDALIKEILPSGDVHLEEERRLFYVAMTRAKTGLYFTWANDYGGKIRPAAAYQRRHNSVLFFLFTAGGLFKLPLPISLCPYFKNSGNGQGAILFW